MRAFLKILFIIFFLPFMMLVILLPWLLRWESARRALCIATFKCINRIINLHIHIQGSLATHRPLMVVSNHSSYLDIFVLGAALPVAFTPKKEIARWPVIGLCCKLAGCVFVDRRPKAIAATKDEIASKLSLGRVMCVFAEGTTNDGTHLKPFKSSLFSLGELEGVRIQPLAILYTHLNHQAVGAEGREIVAWYDDMSLLPHLWRLLNMHRIDAKLQLLELIEPSADRKALCAASERVILEVLADH